jgi:hypothetical protein
MKKQSKKTKLIISLLLLVGLPSSCVYLDLNAKSKAKDFCSQYSVGGDFDKVSNDATSVGNDRLRRIEANKVVVGFIGFSPYSRHLCIVEGVDGKVAETRYFYLD